MGRIIRRTVTLTITETWTIVWTTDDNPQPQAPASWQAQSPDQEEPDEELRSIVVRRERGAAQVKAPNPTSSFENDQ